MRHRGPRVREQAAKDKYRINEDITSREIRLVGADSEQIGVVTREEAMRLADEAGMDLVEVAPGADPPVCRILDYGKLKYREQKKAAETRKHSSTQTVKEIRIRYSTDSHDLETKIRNAKKFLEGGDRVRFQMRFRGREVVYRDLGEEAFKHVAELLSELGSVEEYTPLTNQRMTMTIAPKSEKKSEKK